MIVTLGATTLAAGNREAAAGFRIDASQAVQAVEYVRGTNAVHIGRGNRQTSISFRVAKVHADLETAMEYVLDHPGSLPTSGLLKIETNAGGGDRWIEDAVMVSCRLVGYWGTTTVHEYVLTGGPVLTTDPTPP